MGDTLARGGRIGRARAHFRSSLEPLIRSGVRPRYSEHVPAFVFVSSWRTSECDKHCGPSCECACAWSLSTAEADAVIQRFNACERSHPQSVDSDSPVGISSSDSDEELFADLLGASQLHDGDVCNSGSDSDSEVVFVKTRAAMAAQAVAEMTATTRLEQQRHERHLAAVRIATDTTALGLPLVSSAMRASPDWLWSAVRITVRLFDRYEGSAWAVGRLATWLRSVLGATVHVDTLREKPRASPQRGLTCGLVAVEAGLTLRRAAMQQDATDDAWLHASLDTATRTASTRAAASVGLYYLLSGTELHGIVHKDATQDSRLVGVNNWFGVGGIDEAVLRIGTTAHELCTGTSVETKKPFVFISNTETVATGGSHWILMAYTMTVDRARRR